MRNIEIHISRKRQIFEIKTFAVCFAIAFLLNIFAIISYNASWLELFTSIFYVLTFAIALYVAWGIVRLIVRILFKREKNGSLKKPSKTNN